MFCSPVARVLAVSDAGLLGAALVYVLQLGGLFQWAVRQYSEVGLNLFPGLSHSPHVAAVESTCDWSDLVRQSKIDVDWKGALSSTLVLPQACAFIKCSRRYADKVTVVGSRLN